MRIPAVKRARNAFGLLRAREEIAATGRGADPPPGGPAFAPCGGMISSRALRRFVHGLAWAMPLSVSAGPDPSPAGPLASGEALKQFRIAGDFRIELVAAEPLTTDPVAVAWDGDGGLCVVEMSDYPLGPPGGRVRRLFDDDGDGRMDRETTFAEVAPYPDGLMPWRDGWLVTAAPSIRFLRDADGDGKADDTAVLFEGFGQENPQHNVNGLIWGLDNWIYGASGPSGGTVRVPGRPPVDIHGHDFRMRPDERRFEAVSGISQYGITFDAWGRRFTCDNRCHIRLVMLPEKYLSRNPRLAVPDVQTAIAEYGRYGAPVFPISPQGERFNAPDQAGQFSSACSVHVYRGGAFPPEYDGNAFTCEPVGNLIHRCRLDPDGPGLVARRTEEKTEFLASLDPWCRPVFVTTGPDGLLYVVDMYRAVIEHPEWIPKEIQAKIDLRAGADRGRIYRIVPKSFAGARRPALNRAPSAELVRELANPNVWWRDTAQRLLFERQDRSVVPALREMAATHPDPQARMRALRSLDGLGALETADVRKALADAHPRVREHALELAEPRLREDGDLRAAAIRLAADGDIRVRFQTALTLGEIPDDPATAALAALASREAENPWFRAAILSGVGDRVPAFLRALAAAPAGFFDRTTPGRRQFFRELAAVVGAGEVAAELDALLDTATVPVPRTGPERDASWLDESLIGLLQGASRRGALLADLLARAGDRPALTAAAARLAERSRHTAVDDAAPLPHRLEAVQLLALRPFAEAAPDLLALATPAHRPEIQAAAVQAIGRYNEPDVAPRLLERWAGATPTLRREMIESILRRRDRAPCLLDAIEKSVVRPTDLDDALRRRLLKALEGDARSRAEKALAASPATSRKDAVAAARPALALTGDTARGRTVFDRVCANCHTFDGRGATVGPNLADVRGRAPEALLEDILDPNRAVDPRYASYMVLTKSGQVLSGILAADTPAGLTLRRAGGGEEIVPRADIEDVKTTGQSLMPEGLEQGLSPQDLSDLLAYLRKP